MKRCLKLKMNRDVLRRHNEIFSHKIETKGITNQKKSGPFEIGFVWVCFGFVSS